MRFLIFNVTSFTNPHYSFCRQSFRSIQAHHTPTPVVTGTLSNKSMDRRQTKLTGMRANGLCETCSLRYAYTSYAVFDQFCLIRMTASSSPYDTTSNHMVTSPPYSIPRVGKTICSGVHPSMTTFLLSLPWLAVFPRAAPRSNMLADMRRLLPFLLGWRSRRLSGFQSMNSPVFSA